MSSPHSCSLSTSCIPQSHRFIGTCRIKQWLCRMPLHLHHTVLPEITQRNTYLFIHHDYKHLFVAMYSHQTPIPFYRETRSQTMETWPLKTEKKMRTHPFEKETLSTVSLWFLSIPKGFPVEIFDIHTVESCEPVKITLAFVACVASEVIGPPSWNPYPYIFYFPHISQNTLERCDRASVLWVPHTDRPIFTSREHMFTFDPVNTRSSQNGYHPRKMLQLWQNLCAH